jgi:hypothetical protein
MRVSSHAAQAKEGVRHYFYCHPRHLSPTSYLAAPPRDKIVSKSENATLLAVYGFVNSIACGSRLLQIV